MKPSAPPATAPARRLIKKAVKYGMIAAGGSIAEKFAIAREAGFEGVELERPGNLDLDEILKARDQIGVAIPAVIDSLAWQQSLSDSDKSVRDHARSTLEGSMRDCKALGGGIVSLVPAVVNAFVSYSDAYTRSQAEIRKLLALAKELGVKIAIENVRNDFLLSPLEAGRYIDEFQSEWIGWHFDIGNVVANGWPEQWIHILGKRVVTLDVKDFSRKKRDEEGSWRGFDVEIGEGDVDWPAVRKALDDIKFNGWACADVPAADTAGLKAIADRMDRFLIA